MRVMMIVEFRSALQMGPALGVIKPLLPLGPAGTKLFFYLRVRTLLGTVL